jgi:hypothetical protein
MYTGSYSVSESSDNPKTPQTEEEEECEQIAEPTEEWPQDIPRPMTPLGACFTPLCNSGFYEASRNNDDFPDISMAHAKLYVLAQYTNTPALENDALEKLHKLLVQFTFSNDPHIFESVVGLIQYVYGNTNSLANSEEPMRRVVSTFCATHYLKLLRKPAFKRLPFEGGDFMVDFWDKAGRLIEWERMKSDEVGRNEIKELRRKRIPLQLYDPTEFGGF